MPHRRVITALRSNSNDLTVPPRTPTDGTKPSPRRSSTRSSLWQRRSEMSGRLTAGQVSFRRLSNVTKKPNSGGGSGRLNFATTFRLASSSFPSFLSAMAAEGFAKFNSSEVKTLGGKLAVPSGGSTSEIRVNSSTGKHGATKSRPQIMTAVANSTVIDLPSGASRPPNLKVTLGDQGRSVIRRNEFRRNSSQLHLWLGRSHLPMLQAKFTGSQDQGSDDGGSIPLIRKLDKYTSEELKEYRQVFNMFDTDRSGAIGLDEMENAITNLGMDPKQVDLEMLIREADKRGNHQIDFDEVNTKLIGL
ncbi:HLH domain-containing protein [Aphelenchoides besseyi]|nr:HLH domain-containing protein [Aphelenchoides besseyi]